MTAPYRGGEGRLRLEARRPLFPGTGLDSLLASGGRTPTSCALRLFIGDGEKNCCETTAAGLHKCCSRTLVAHSAHTGPPMPRTVRSSPSPPPLPSFPVLSPSPGLPPCRLATRLPLSSLFLPRALLPDSLPRASPFLLLLPLIRGETTPTLPYLPTLFPFPPPSFLLFPLAPSSAA
jgi:hypothetical protein